MLSDSARRNARRGLAVVFVVVLVVAAVALGYLSTPLHGRPAGIAAVDDDPDVHLTERDGGYVLAPASGESSAGLIFYPGGRVAPDAYLASLAPLVERANVTVFVPAMPLNLAVLAPDRASRIVAAHPGIDTWYVGGHSLGGAMACRYASSNPSVVAGVVLLAAYCDVPVGGTTDALVVTGSADTVLDREAVRENRDNLPIGSQTVELSGVNHSQFGDYTGQRGDGPAAVSYDEAHATLTDVLVEWFETRGGDTPTAGDAAMVSGLS